MPDSAIAVSYPWQQEQWQHLEALHQAGRLPHALLLAGAGGVGKTRFALAFAHYLLCESPELGSACGKCRQCGFNLQGVHPDINWLTLEEKSRQIKIDQVRGLVAGLDQTAQQGGYKVAVITPAESMNVNAANALLKCLEEATPDTLMVLISDTPSQLLPTIRSRCQVVNFAVPEPAQSVAWLTAQLPAQSPVEALLIESAGQPLTALRLFQQEGMEQRNELTRDFMALLSGRVSALKIAEKWLDYDLSECLLWLSRKLSGMIQYRLAGREGVLDSQWQALAAGINTRQVYALLDDVNQLMNALNKGANPNQQLALEKLLLDSCEKIRA